MAVCFKAPLKYLTHLSIIDALSKPLSFEHFKQKSLGQRTGQNILKYPLSHLSPSSILW
jgi:hypothetical protein